MIGGDVPLFAGRCSGFGIVASRFAGRSGMSDPALPKRRAASLERATRADAVNANGRADVGSSDPATGMESPDASKAR